MIPLPVSIAAWCVVVVFKFAAVSIAAQEPAALLHVEVKNDGAPVASAEVVVNGTTHLTDSAGRVHVTAAPGRIDITVTKDGFVPAAASVEVQAGERRTIAVDLQALRETVVVTAARSRTRLEDQPVRVEVIDREEIEEKAMMTPGSVAMLVGETTGLRVQTTAPSLGAANVRIQGLRGRYSQLMTDGLPLYGTQGDSFSLLQVPPLDLGRVEIIKGVASALYGASALGGVINLVSRQPRTRELELLVNATSQAGGDIAGWYAQEPRGSWSWTLLGSVNGQRARDPDDDGWTDVPNVERAMIRPRLFFDNRRGTTAFATAGAIVEDRDGGTRPGRTAPDGNTFREALETRHVDGAAVGRWVTMGNRLISARGSVLRHQQKRQWGEATEQGVRTVAFAEASLQGSRGRHTWVAGGAFQQDRFVSRDLPQFDYRFVVPAAFAQDEIAFGSRWTIGVSARADVHSEYGVLATPRVSVLARPASGWTLRLSAGAGAFAPTPFTEETEETGLSPLLPLRGLRAERAHGASVDVTRTLGPLEVTGTVFGSNVDHPVLQQIVDPHHVRLVNVSGPTRTVGTELLLRYRADGFTALVTHAWTQSSEIDPDRGDRRDVPLTPAQAASFTLMWDFDGAGRIGFEGYYTGRQPLDENPYRSTGSRYMLVGALAERRIGPVRLFVNAENLFDVRQTRYDPLVLPSQRPPGRWTVDAWAPLDGRVINGGARVAF